MIPDKHTIDLLKASMIGLMISNGLNMDSESVERRLARYGFTDKEIKWIVKPFTGEAGDPEPVIKEKVGR